MKKIIISAILSSILTTSSVFAKDDLNNTKISNINKQTLTDAKKSAENKKVKLVQEAIESLKLSSEALKKLEENKSDEAKKDIEKALGKIEVILSSDHTPKLLPIENRTKIVNFLGDANAVEKALDEVKKLIKKGKVQNARVLLNTLQSEIDISVINLPLATYPDALKLASKYIIEDKPQKAKEVLKLALSTFTQIDEIIPIPMINAINLVYAASDISKKDKDQAVKYLQAASDELDKAEKLGYISKSTTTYKELHSMIKNVQKEVNKENKTDDLFKTLSDKLQKFKEKIFSFENHDKQ